MSTLDSPNTPSTPAPPIWNTVLRYGGICALALVAYSLISYLMDVDVTSISAGIINFFVALGVTVGLAIMAIRYQRELDGGFMTYGRGLLIGLCTVAIGAFLANIWNFVLVNFIDPDYVTRLKEGFLENWGESMPPEALEEALERFDKMGDIGTNLTAGAGYALFIGLVAGLIAAAFGMKSQPTNI